MKYAINNKTLIKDYETAFTKEMLNEYEFVELDLPYNDVIFEDFDNKNFNIDKYNQRKNAEKNNQRKAEIKSMLVSLSEDITQDQAGEYVPNINERKVEFIKLHNELRELEGKAPRILK